MKARYLSLLLFLSGAGTLILEVTWFRRMAQVAGATSVAMGAILAAVIGGMALGSFWVGRFADRAARPLRLYGWLEAGIALAALLTPTVLDLSQGGFDALQRNLGETPAVLAVTRFLLATLLLTPPSILMGGTLPSIACALRTTPDRRGRALGWLYAANTLGAVAGTFLAGFVLIGSLGLAWSMRSAALLSGTAAVVALLVRAGAGEATSVAGGEPAPDGRRAVVLFAVSGFLGLVAEVAFARHLVLVFGSTTYAFTTMLGVFLLGIGLGSAIGAWLARREAGHCRVLENTVATTAAIFSLGALLVYLLPRFYLDGLLAWGDGLEARTWLRLLLSLPVLLPGALGLGIAFPLAAHVASAGAIGAGTGRLYAVNTLASIIGSTLAVFVFVPWLGPHYTVAVVAVAAATIAALSARRVLPAVLVVVAAAGLWPPQPQAQERLLAGVYFNPDAWITADKIDEKAWDLGVDIPFHEYGREATVAIWRWYGTNSVLIDGKAVATNQVLADVQHLALLGHIPMALHADPQRVLVVGLGMGTTHDAVALHTPMLLRVVELEPAVVDAAARLGVRPNDLVIADARSYLRATYDKFDVITSDPIHPWVRGGGDLYTVEYFEACRDRLLPRGIACQWLPVYQMGVEDLRNVVRTFCSVFPAAQAYYGAGDLILVGMAKGPFPKPRALPFFPATALRLLGAEPLSDLLVADHARLVAAAGPGPLLTDDSLRLEYSVPRYMDNHALAECFEWVRDLWEDPPDPYRQVLAAQIAQARDDYEFALLQLFNAAKAAPDHPFVTRYRGELSLFLADSDVRYGELKSAEYNLTRARLRLPNDPRIVGVEAELRIAQGKPKQAAALFEALLKRNPDSAYLKRRLALLK